jgi:excisionase family DNA binding protein
MLEEYRDVLTAGQVQEVLGISKMTLYRLLNDGEIKSIRIGRIFKIPKVYLIEYILNEQRPSKEE